MKISQLKVTATATTIAICLLATAFMFFTQAAPTVVIDDVFADGNSQNQDLLNNSLAVYKAKSGSTRNNAVGYVEYTTLSTTGGSEAFWAHFTNGGAPVNLGIGDKITYSGTFSTTGIGTNAVVRFGLFNSKNTRVTADKTGGQSDSLFGDDVGYGAEYAATASGSGSPFKLFRRDVVTPAYINIFNSMMTMDGTNPTGWTDLVGTGSATRQPLTNNIPYNFVYSVERISENNTKITVAVTGGTLANLSHTATETSAAPYTAFDWFTFRINGASFASSLKFSRFLVEYNPAAPQITTQPAPPSQTIQVGNRADYSVTASGSGLSYQWLKDGNPIIGNATATMANLTLTNLQIADSGNYSVRVTNSGGMATSSAVSLTVVPGQTEPPPVITNNPQNTTVVVGQPAALSVTATGDNLSYQWFKNDVLISGATLSTLNFAAAATADTGNYTVRISNVSGTVTSNPARLTVVSAMTVTGYEPSNNTANVCTDAPLRLTFNQTPKIGTSGRLRVYRADATLIDTIDLAANPQTKTIGGISAFRYFPVIVTGNTAAIYLHQQLAYNQTYYVTVEPGVFTDLQDAPFGGFSDASIFRFSTKTAAPVAGTNPLTVAANGTGDFCTIQGAIDFVPANNAQRRIINVKNGTYTEIIYIPSNKPQITVKGESRAGTIQRYANNNNLNGAISGNYRTSFGVDATDFSVENITLHNTTPQLGSQAEALRIGNVRATINSVNLLSYQDTLLTQRSAFVTNSYIEGDVDFMWGNGATYYKNTEMKSLRNGGYYTQIRNDSTTPGNVYVNCRLTKGAGITSGNYLARIDPDEPPNGFPYSQVVFIDSQMDSHIAPAGWLIENSTNMPTTANYPNIRFWESNSKALDGVTPIDCSQRDPIARNDCRNPLSASEIAFYRNPLNITGFTPQEKLTAIVSLSNLSPVYDGTPKPAAVTTDPNGLTVDVTYNGSTTAPTNAGTYTVVATVNDANYQGSATGNLTIARAATAITLGNLTQIYDGAPKAVSVSTVPANVTTTVTYNGSTALPTAVGNYTVVAAVSNPNYIGTATANLNIRSTIKAFAGAEGAGAYAVGGRGGDTYHVTNLNDSGAGSLRNGITSATGARTIVFDVSGTIYLNSRLDINKPFMTIAGQTAPGDGITIAGWTSVVNNTQHVILRYLRFRAGDIRCSSGMEGDSLWVDDSKDVMVDHVSASWSIDESLSVTDADRVSIQWSFITESLNNSCHPEGRHGYGTLIRYGSGRVSFHHNLYAHHFNRNPRVGDNITLDFVNNVIYDWGTDASYSGAAIEGTTKINYIGNYLVAGPNTAASKRFRAFNGGSVNTLIYQTGNVIDGNINGIHDGTDTGWAMFNGIYTQQNTPLDFSGRQSFNYLVDVNPDDAATAYSRVLSSAGQSRSRDAVDTRIVSQATNETGSYINSQTEVGGFPTLVSQSAPTDTDGDGIPDFWESSNGLNPNDPNDASAVAANGYTNLENYLNSSFAPTAAGANVGGRVLTASGRGISKARVTLINATNGVSKTIQTNPFGYYNFYDLPTAQTYIISVADKRHRFNNPSTVVTVNSEIAGLNFTAEN